MIPVHKNRFIIDRIAGYWATVLDDYPESSSFRKFIYFMEGVLIGIFVFLWLEFAQMGELYHWLYPIIVSSMKVFGHYLVTEIFFKRWQPVRISIGKILADLFSWYYFEFHCGLSHGNMRADMLNCGFILPYSLAYITPGYDPRFL